MSKTNYFEITHAGEVQHLSLERSSFFKKKETLKVPNLTNYHVTSISVYFLEGFVFDYLFYEVMAYFGLEGRPLRTPVNIIV